MTTPDKQNRQRRLGPDGELDTLADTLDDSAEAEPVYCNRCGTPNASNATYCRKCGRSLVEQEAEMLGVPRQGRKTKHDLAMSHAPEPELVQKRAAEPHPLSTSAVMLMQVINLVSVGLLSIRAIGSAAMAWTVVPILIGWFLVEAVGNGARRNMRPEIAIPAVLRHLVTMALVTIVGLAGLGSAATAWMIVPLVIFWFLVTAVRSH